MSAIPQTQQAVQLVGPDELRINNTKPVPEPGRHQILAEVEATGLCFSDLKLLKQFSAHARKSGVARGIDPTALTEMPNYVPGDKPAVPGHETVVRIVAAGPGVERHKVGQRYLVQTDYRWLPTGSSNAAFGYNFEGALQQYVLMDERVIVSPQSESMLIPVPEDLPASALALIEPWACVENSYVETQRQTLKEGGRLLAVGEKPVSETVLRKLPGRPSYTKVTTANRISEMDDVSFDDIIYFGSRAASVECLFPKLAAGGLLTIVQHGGRFGRPVVMPVGRIHYGGIRITGTRSKRPEDALAAVPRTVEIRPHDRINVIGAAGPMGSMHVIRALCQGVADVSVFAGDLSDDRLAVLGGLAEPLASRNGLALTLYNPANNPPRGPFNYIVLMVPAAALIPQAIDSAAKGAIINLFAGIPAETKIGVDLDAYIERQLYFVGTSGSVLEDMERVLAKVVSRQLDTNLLVAAVSGLDGAIDGIRAVEKNLMPGKIVVYPSCRGLPLKPLEKLGTEVPLNGGRWTAGSEKALLKLYGRP
jgi:threonine dehydrogenase-like Zn-dependent dehydrogenase